jgi:nitroreductase
VQDNLSALKDVVWGGITQAQSQAGPISAELLERLLGFEKLREQGTDYLFRDAPAVIYIAAASAVDAALAAQNMEHMAIAQGLGVLYDGFLVGAANLLETVREWLDTGDKPVQVCMLAGYPRVEYRRTAPRKPADIRWK